MNSKDIFIRAIKTFIQAFIPVVAAAFAASDVTELGTLKSVAYSALISGAAAGISAVWNVLLASDKAQIELEEETEEKEVTEVKSEENIEEANDK